MFIIDKNKTDHLKKILSDHIPVLVRKTTPTWIRQTTENDLTTCLFSPGTEDKEFIVGHIWTKEGLQKMETQICRGINGELWPTTTEDTENFKFRHPDYPEDDCDGWGVYLSKYPVLSIQMSEPFRIVYKDQSTLDGKAGDFLLMSVNLQSIWLCEADIFNVTYKPEIT